MGANKINKILEDAGRTVLCIKSYGRTKEWVMKEMKWLPIEKYYENSVQNTIYKFLNNDNDHYFKDYLTKNRTVRIQSQNKVGHHDVTMGRSIYTQRTLLYVAVSIYNKLPKNITLIKSQPLFKKWCKRYNFNNSIKLRDQEDNTNIITKQTSDFNRMEECVNNFNDD